MPFPSLCFRHEATPSNLLRGGGKECEILPQISTPLAFEPLLFETKQYIGNFLQSWMRQWLAYVLPKFDEV